MKSLLYGLSATLILAAAGSITAHANSTSAHQVAQHHHATHSQASQLTVSHAWIRVLPGALPGAGYAVIHNHGDSPAVIVAAQSSAYRKVMLHKSEVRNGVSKMIAVPRLRVPAHGKIRLHPGGYHLMMMHARKSVQPNHMVPVTLKLADGSTAQVRFLARPANASSDAH